MALHHQGPASRRYVCVRTRVNDAGVRAGNTRAPLDLCHWGTPAGASCGWLFLHDCVYEEVVVECGGSRGWLVGMERFLRDRRF